MARFLYYLPGKPTVEEAAQVIGHEVGCRGPVRGGPDGKDGSLWEAQDHSLKSRTPKPLGFHPEHQAWAEAPGDSGLWIGYQKDSPPTPTDLRKLSDLVRGESIKLRDDNEWVVPVIRDLAGNSGLPRVVDLVDGKYVRAIDPQYLDLFVRVKAIADHLFAERPEDHLNTEMVLEMVADALKIHYSIGKAEIAILRLVNDKLLLDMVNILVGKPGLLRIMDELGEDKKKESDSTG